MANKTEILIISEDRIAVESVSSLFKQRGFSPFGVYTGQKGLELALNNAYGLIILDLTLPDIDSLELLKKIKGARISAPVIVTGSDDISDKAAEATKLGAFDLIETTENPDLIFHTAKNALKHLQLEQDLSKLKKSLSEQHDFIGRSDVIEQFREKIRRIAPSSSRVLFTGESGSGKLGAAKFMHYSSNRATEPFMTVNCTVLDTGKVINHYWLESELFGHQKGAFVGATGFRKGKFELADSGTLFLNEVGSLPLDIQAKLLRTIETNTIRRVGSDDEKKVDVRLMSSTSVNLEQEIKKGRFREDLYFRLNVIPISVPPLRTHPGDIPVLTRHFLDKAGYLNLKVDKEAMDFLQSYKWPGNVRELKNTIEKAAGIAHGDTISFACVNSASAVVSNQTTQGLLHSVVVTSNGQKQTSLYRPDMSYRKQLIDLERRLLTEVYQRCGGNITRAAAMLKTDRGNLSKKLKKLGVKKD